MSCGETAVCIVSLGMSLMGAGRTALADDEAVGALRKPVCGVCQPAPESNDFPCGPSYLPTSLRALIIQQFAGADFRPACRAHDQCYDFGMPKQCCDAAFEAELVKACESAWCRPGCKIVAGTMSLSVRLFGALSFPISIPIGPVREIVLLPPGQRS